MCANDKPDEQMVKRMVIEQYMRASVALTATYIDDDRASECAERVRNRNGYWLVQWTFGDTSNTLSVWPSEVLEYVLPDGRTVARFLIDYDDDPESGRGKPMWLTLFIRDVCRGVHIAPCEIRDDIVLRLYAGGHDAAVDDPDFVPPLNVRRTFEALVCEHPIIVISSSKVSAYKIPACEGVIVVQGKT